MINLSKLHQELVAAGIPMIGVDETGRIDFAPEATQGQRQHAAQIVAAHDPEPSAHEKRRAAFFKAVMVEEIIEGLFEYLLENKPGKLQALQQKRQEIKALFPDS